MWGWCLLGTIYGIKTDWLVKYESMYYYIVQWGLISDIIQDLQDLQGEGKEMGGKRWKNRVNPLFFRPNSFVSRKVGWKSSKGITKVNINFRMILFRKWIPCFFFLFVFNEIVESLFFMEILTLDLLLGDLIEWNN